MAEIKDKLVTAEEAKFIYDNLKEETSAIKNDLTELQEAVYGEVETEYSGSYTTPNGIINAVVNIVDCDISSGTEYKITVFCDNGTSAVLYEKYADGTLKSVGRKDFNTQYTLTSQGNITHFGLYQTGLNINTTVTIDVTAVDSSKKEQSLEYRVEQMSNVIPKMEEKLENLDKTVLGIANFIEGEKLNSDGTLSDNPNFKTSDFIDTSDLHNKVVRFYYGDVSEPVVLVHYDSNKNRINATSYTAGQEYRAFTLGTADYVRFSYAKDYKGKFVSGTSSPLTTIWEDNREDGIIDLIRKRIDIKATDDAETFITKMIDAFNTKNCDVYFERAVYDISAEIPYIKSKYGMNHNETPIGNGCRYFFNGATIKGRYNLDDLTPEAGDDEFYGNLLGCQRVPSSFELYDGILIATDTRYVVHDESAALEGTYRHLYHNMVMEYHTELRTEDIRKCLGGGTGASGVIDIEGCVFITDGTDSCASFHGNAADVVGAEFNINVRNSWFSNSFRAGALSAHQTGRLLYSGNSAKSNPRYYDGWTHIVFCNEIRQ